MDVYSHHAIECVKQGRLRLAIAYLRMQLELERDAAQNPPPAPCTICGGDHHSDNHLVEALDAPEPQQVEVPARWREQLDAPEPQQTCRHCGTLVGKEIAYAGDGTPGRWQYVHVNEWIPVDGHLAEPLPAPDAGDTATIPVVPGARASSHAPTSCVHPVMGGNGGQVPCGELIQWREFPIVDERSTGWYHASDRWLGANNHPATPGVLLMPISNT